MRRLDDLWPPRNTGFQANVVTTLSRTWRHWPALPNTRGTHPCTFLAPDGTRRDGPAGAEMELLESLSRYQRHETAPANTSECLAVRADTPVLFRRRCKQ